MTISVRLEAAQAALLALAEPLPAIERGVDEARGRYLAAPLLARLTRPAVDLSAMDGYAIGDDVQAGAWTLVGESAAGHPYDGAVPPTGAVRISTGAVVPDGGRLIIPQENVARYGDRITLIGEIAAHQGRHIRRRGSDFVTGGEVAAAGSRLDAARLALGLAAGHVRFPVHGDPMMVALDTGDELNGRADENRPGMIRASNAAMLCAMAPVIVRSRRPGPIPDRQDALLAALDDARDADVIVTSGGASVGDRDLLQPALERWGATIICRNVAIKPGKPLIVAIRDRQILLGLPGNPAAAFVTAHLFLLPLLRRLGGAAEPLPTSLTLPLAVPMKETGMRQEYVRGRVDRAGVVPLGNQDTGSLSHLAGSSLLIERSPFSPPARAGDLATVHLTTHPLD